MVDVSVVWMEGTMDVTMVDYLVESMARGSVVSKAEMKDACSVYARAAWREFWLVGSKVVP